jgi:hypothetical protein
LSVSPPDVLHETTDPCPTVTLISCKTSGGETLKGADCGGAGSVDAVSGTLGPGRTPARRGHTTPATKPLAATTPTPIHEGRSASADGMRTVSGLSALREDIEPTIYHTDLRRAQSAATPKSPAKNDRN